MNSNDRYNLINGNGLKEDTKLYRIISKERLYDLFLKNENVLAHPSLWGDPFENFILNSPVQSNSGGTGSFSFHDDLYGQCWSLHRVSDAMWRIYSKDKDEVRIRTTLGKLAKGLSKIPSVDWHSQCYIGRVQYLTTQKLNEFAGNVFQHGINAEAIAKTLCVKRMAFKHEREVRLVYIDHKHAKNGACKLHSYSIEPHELIDQIMINPWYDVEKLKEYKREIKKMTGYKGEVKHSLLYAPPKDFVVIIP